MRESEIALPLRTVRAGQSHVKAPKGENVAVVADERSTLVPKAVTQRHRRAASDVGPETRQTTQENAALPVGDF